MLEPDYGEGVNEALDEIEFDESRKDLWRSIVETLKFVLANPDDKFARRHAIRTPDGGTVWRVPIPAPGEEDRWSLLWEPDGEYALIHYIGIWPPPTEQP